jgi:beta-lactamase superfamily II metal-dependent hydrolase
MIQYDGSAPAADEIEITLLGRGFGEAIAVHLGGGTWMLADSCLCPHTGRPASADYLDQIGVSPKQVRVIIATHWHDDHVRGISELAKLYPDAEFVLSSVFSTAQAAAYLAAYSGVTSTNLAAGTRELFDVVQHKVVGHAHCKSIVLQDEIHSRPILVTALAPVQASFSRALARMAYYLPEKDDAITHAPPKQRTNIESIVLHIDLGDDAILLGADLEKHCTCGWTAVVNDNWSGSRRPASAYKVAHHGSRSGDCPGIWSKLLIPDPIICLTPYTLGGKLLPTDDDRLRMRNQATYRYLASGASRKPNMAYDQLSRLNDICTELHCLEGNLGAIRLRKQPGAVSWTPTVFGAALRI